ncbi:MAG: glycosyltransferase family 4 protein [Bdellovibrionales bacterium]|nr:glycosyltransferase family 4 protein [Bdellovibrionales bacterium]
MKILALLQQTGEGKGGIAQYNGVLVDALSKSSLVSEVIVASRAGGRLSLIWQVIRAVFFERRISMILCGHIHFLSLAYLANFFLRKPIVLILYGIESWQPSGRMVTDFLARRTTRIISISDFTYQKFIAWSNLNEEDVNYTLLPCSVDTSRFTPGNPSSELVERYGLQGKIVLLTLARLDSLERYKGIDEVLGVLPSLCKENEGLVYLLGGDGDDRERLEQKVADLELQDRVIFAGRIVEEEKLDFYRLGDLFVMPGQGEGFGVVYLEALACGVPVVGSKRDGSREALRDGLLGSLVDPNDSKELQSVISQDLQGNMQVSSKELAFFSRESFQKRVESFLTHFTD